MVTVKIFKVTMHCGQRMITCIIFVHNNLAKVLNYNWLRCMHYSFSILLNPGPKLFKLWLKIFQIIWLRLIAKHVKKKLIIIKLLEWSLFTCNHTVLHFILIIHFHCFVGTSYHLFYHNMLKAYLWLTCKALSYYCQKPTVGHTSFTLR